MECEKCLGSGWYGNRGPGGSRNNEEFQRCECMEEFKGICPHGALKRQCLTCELEEEIATLRARIAELEAGGWEGCCEDYKQMQSDRIAELEKLARGARGLLVDIRDGMKEHGGNPDEECPYCMGELLDGDEHIIDALAEIPEPEC